MHSPEVRKVLSYRFVIFAILSLAYLLVYFHRLSLSVVADTLVKEFATSASVMGLLGSVYFYCYAVMQLPAGLLSDSIGPRKSVTFFLLIASAGSILFGLSPNISVAFAGRILVGFGVSMAFIPTIKILSQWFRPNEFAFMAGILQAVGGAGVLAATWLLAVMTVNFGWRLSFELIGIVTLIVVVLNWFIVRDKPQDKGWPSILEIDNKEKHAASTIKEIPLWEGVKRVVSETYFWPVAIWFFFDCGIFFGFGALWSGPYLMHIYGMPREEAGKILSMLAWGMIIGGPLVGIFSDKILKSRKKPFIICTMLLVNIILLMYMFPKGFSIPALYVLFFAFSVCSSAIVVMAFTTTKEMFPVEIAGTSVGMVNLFPFLGGAVFMPLLGRILDAYPKTEPWLFAGRIFCHAFCSSFICRGRIYLTLFMKETFQE